MRRSSLCTHPSIRRGFFLQPFGSAVLSSQVAHKYMACPPLAAPLWSAKFGDGIGITGSKCLWTVHVSILIFCNVEEVPHRTVRCKRLSLGLLIVQPRLGSHTHDIYNQSAFGSGIIWRLGTHRLFVLRSPRKTYLICIVNGMDWRTNAWQTDQNDEKKKAAYILPWLLLRWCHHGIQQTEEGLVRAW